MLMPFAYSGNLVDPVLLPRQILLTLFLIIVILVRYKMFLTAKFSIPEQLAKSFLLLMLLILFASNLLSAILSPNTIAGMYIVSKFSVEIVYFFITVLLLFKEDIVPEDMVRSVVFFAFFISIIALFQIITYIDSWKDISAYMHKIKSTSANKNLLGSVLFLTLPYMAYEIMTYKKIAKYIAISIFFCALIILIIIQSRAVIGGIGISVIVLLGLMLGFRKQIYSERRIPSYVRYITVFFIIALIVFVFLIPHLPNLLNTNTFFTRAYLWDNTLKMIKDNWLIGVGPGNWQVFFPAYGLEIFVNQVSYGLTTYQRPHNDFLWVFSESGIAGFLALIFLFVTCFIYTKKILRRSLKQAEKLMALLIFSSLAGYQFIAFFDFPMERIEHQVLVMTGFALITYLFIKSRTEKKILHIKSVLTVIMLLVCAFSLLVSGYRCKGEFHSRKLYDAHHAAQWDEMIAEADKAGNVFYIIDPMSAPLEWYKGVAFFSKGNIQEAFNSFEKAYQIHPYHIHVLNNLAGCYEKMQNHSKAIEFYTMALNISPKFYESRLNLSAVYFNMGNYNRAFETIDMCPASCTDPKYKSFLPSILKAKVIELRNKESDSSKKVNLTLLLDDEKKINDLYIQSKKNRCKFVQLITSYK